jgi:hypothetical protein
MPSLSAPSKAPTPSMMRLRVHRVAELVIDDVGDAAGVLAAGAGDRKKLIWSPSEKALHMSSMLTRTAQLLVEVGEVGGDRRGRAP